MKRFCINLLIFFAIIAVGDFVIGKGLDYWKANKSEGYIENLEYTYRKSNDDVVIFGASRASDHYVPQIITDSLNLSCYNCGRNGMGILYAYGRWRMLRSHHKPKLVIYDVTPNDYSDEKSYYRYLRDLRPYYKCDGMDELFNDIDSLEKYKLTSRLYRNNSKWLEIFIGHKLTPIMEKGYTPVFGKIGKNYLKHDTIYTINAMKMKYMEKLIQETQKDHVKLVFLISPYYVRDFAHYPDELKNLFDKYSVPYYDNSIVEGLTDNPDLFVITKHLNDKGAKAYTRYIIPQIREVLGKPDKVCATEGGNDT